MFYEIFAIFLWHPFIIFLSRSVPYGQLDPRRKTLYYKVMRERERERERERKKSFLDTIGRTNRERDRELSYSMSLKVVLWTELSRMVGMYTVGNIPVCNRSSYLRIPARTD